MNWTIFTNQQFTVKKIVTTVYVLKFKRHIYLGKINKQFTSQPDQAGGVKGFTKNLKLQSANFSSLQFCLFLSQFYTI